MKKISFSANIRKLIKPIISVILCIAIFGGAFIGSYYINRAITKEYTVQALVVNIDEETHEISFLINSGHLFIIKTDEVFAINENYLITFKTYNTPTVEDDEIIKISREIIV